MGTTFIKSQPEPEAKLSTEWQKAKPALIFYEPYSEESSEAVSTPSCRSLEGDPEVLLKGIQETPALQELEETVMQARAAEDYKQARKLKARRSSVTLITSDLSDSPMTEPIMSSSRIRDQYRSRVDTWDVSGMERDLGSEDETQKKTKADVKRSADTTSASRGSITSEDSSFGSLASVDSPKPAKHRKALSKKVSTTEKKSSSKLDRK